MDKRRNHYKRKRKKWPWIVIIVLIVLVGAGAVYGYSIWHNVKSTVNEELHKPIDGIDTHETKNKVDNKDPIRILLLGVDERKGDRGRSDTMIVMSLDPNQDQMQLVSIPRDTRTQIIGKGSTEKINHAYAYGKSEMAVDTVENLLDMDLDYYVRMNMKGLSQLVNAVGGINVTNEYAFTQSGYSFDAGQQQLDGKKALAYVRQRKKDPKGDLGRNDRQRQVVEGIIKEGAQFNVVNEIGDIMDVLDENMVTNMKFADMKNLAKNYRGARKDITDYQMSGKGTRIDGRYYQIMSDEEISKVHEMITEFGS